MGEFTNPVEDVALGDPFVLRHRGRFYLYGTNDGPPLPDGRVIPVYRSDDLFHWTPLGGALVPEDPGADHWAPEVLAWNGRFFMVVSFGDVDRRGHALWVAVSDRPEGPFSLRCRVSDPADKFSIDGSWLLDDDGKLYLFRCLDFVEEGAPPYGTGIVAQPMRDPFTPSGPPAVVLRAHAPWQLFLADRTMPLYGGRTFAEWTTIEGPSPVRRGGRYFCGYSGGNYTGAYGTGEAVADAPLGPYRDLRGGSGPIFGTTPGLVDGPGHFSVIQPDLVHDWIVLHGRVPGEGVRRVWLCPVSWGPDGVTFGALTDRPQPAPPSPTDLSRFADATGPVPAGWSLDPAAGWRLEPDGLRHVGKGSKGFAARADLTLSGDWAAELYLRFPTGGAATGGVQFVSPSGQATVAIRAGGGGKIVLGENSHERPEVACPTLGGEPFDPERFHRVEVHSRSGRAEIRVDGVVVAADLVTPTAPCRVFLSAEGPVVFDAASLTLIEGRVS